jgi:hypothetical protein
MMGHRLVCGGCGHTDTVANDPSTWLYKCDQCGARTAFGQLMPAVRVLPDVDKRFVVVRFTWGRKEVDARIDRDYAVDLARELLSVCAPGLYQLMCARMRGGQEPPAVLDAPPPTVAARRETSDDVESRLAELNAQGLCPCGAPATHANGFCSACVARALAGT